MNISATLGRSTSGTSTFVMNAKERGSIDMWHYQLSRNPSFWAFAAASREYTADARVSDTGASATLKK